VLDLAKVEAGKFDFHAEPLDLNRLLGEVRDVLRTVAQRKRIKVEIDADATLGSVTSDASKIKQILFNYLSNALKFTPEDGCVRVRCCSEPLDSFRIEVEDNGIGIKQEDFARLFVEFQQLDGSAAKRYQGTGLGLALTKRLAEALGGHVEVRSAIGSGSCFAAVLPRVLHLAEESHAA
jgi:signal transduction histidine kinase